MKSSSAIAFVVMAVLIKKTCTNSTGFNALNNSGLIFKTAKTCAQRYRLDFISATSIYIKGNFNEIKEDQKCFLQCITENLKLWAEHEEPNYDKIMQHVDFLILGDKKGLREKVETCITSTASTSKNFCNHLHNAYKCFWTSTKGLGHQYESLLAKLKIDLNKKI